MNFIIFTPYDINKNLAKAYNSCMELLEDDQFGVFVDGDTIFTTTYFGHQINDIIEKNENCNAFTCLTNRVNTKWQVVKTDDSDDIFYHRKVGSQLKEKYKSEIYDVTDNKNMSGFFIAIRKKLWKKIGGFKGEKMLMIDNTLHHDIRESNNKLYCAPGLYLYHWYLGDNIWDKNRSTNHLR